MKSNQELHTDIYNALKWEPLLHAAEIGSTAKYGVVSLLGVVDNYVKGMEVENATKKVIGVKALVENIKVNFPSNWSKTDAEIANEVLTGLQNNWLVPIDKVAVKVEDGWVTLEGEMPWKYQKEAAKSEVSHLLGVKGVTNKIIIKSVSHDAIEKKAIERVIARSESFGVSDIYITVSGTTVTLTGTVNSWYQKEEASRIAWNTPGIGHVKNELTVDYHYALTNYKFPNQKRSLSSFVLPLS
ncbi:MAG: osmotically-inducible protein OsmY [Cyclobacteriaceae bacterium]|jgi:osmotically-inducible protein OsmY